MNLLIVTMNGVLRKTKSGKKFINDPKDQVLVPEMVDVLKRAKAKNYTIVGVSNEGGVEHCHKTLDSCLLEQKYTLALADGLLDAVYFSPYTHQGYGVYHKVAGHSQFVKHGWEYVKRAQTLNGFTEDTYLLQHNHSVFRLPDTGLWVPMVIDLDLLQPIPYSRQSSIVKPEKICMIASRGDYLFATKLGIDCYDVSRFVAPNINAV